MRKDIYASRTLNLPPWERQTLNPPYLVNTPKALLDSNIKNSRPPVPVSAAHINLPHSHKETQPSLRTPVTPLEASSVVGPQTPGAPAR